MPRQAGCILGKPGAENVANPIPLALNPIQMGRVFSVKYPDLAQSAQRFVRIARNLTPRSYQTLAEVSRQLVFRERLRPSASSHQLQSRVKAAASSALWTGALDGYLTGDDPAVMAVIIILMLVQDQETDLQSQMAEQEAQMAAKQALRALTDEMSHFLLTGAQSEPY
jgi:hypothetical protein